MDDSIRKDLIGGMSLVFLVFLSSQEPLLQKMSHSKQKNRISIQFQFGADRVGWQYHQFLANRPKKTHPCKVLDLLDTCSPSEGKKNTTSTTYQTNRPAVSRSGLSIVGTWLWDFRLQKSFKYPAVNRFFSHDFRCGGSGCYWFHRQIGVCASGENSSMSIFQVSLTWSQRPL